MGQGRKEFILALRRFTDLLLMPLGLGYVSEPHGQALIERRRDHPHPALVFERRATEFQIARLLKPGHLQQSFQGLRIRSIAKHLA